MFSRNNVLMIFLKSDVSVDLIRFCMNFTSMCDEKGSWSIAIETHNLFKRGGTLKKKNHLYLLCF